MLLPSHTNTHIYTPEWPHFTLWENNFWNQQRIPAKTMRLGENTSVLTFQRNQLRGTHLSTHPNNDGIVIHLRTCPFNRHMCSIVNLYILYPMNVLVELDISDPRTCSDWLPKRQLWATTDCYPESGCVDGWVGDWVDTFVNVWFVGGWHCVWVV